jgi:hypothetical protein
MPRASLRTGGSCRYEKKIFYEEEYSKKKIFCGTVEARKVQCACGGMVVFCRAAYSRTYEMLQAAAFGSPQALDKFAAFINAMLAFEMPRAPSLLDSKGVAFLKPGPANVRPIAISEAWLRQAQ